MGHLSEPRLTARLELVREHVRLENAHDLEGILKTFGDAVACEDRAWDEDYPGAGGIRSCYEQLLEGSSDLRIDIQKEHVSDAGIVLDSRCAPSTASTTTTVSPARESVTSAAPP